MTWVASSSTGDIALGRKVYWLRSFKRKTVETTRYCNVNLVQPRVLCLYYVLKGLEAGGYKSVAEDDLSHSQLPIGVDKNFGPEYPRQVRLVDEIKV